MEYNMAGIKNYNIDEDQEALDACAKILDIIYKNVKYEKDEEVDTRPREKILTPVKQRTKGGQNALSEQDVLEIRRLAGVEKLTSTVIATMFPTTARNVRNIVARNTWKHI